MHGTYAVAINDSGNIAGYYFDANYVEHGFLRDRHGSITTIDVPQATATLALSINAEGEIVGSYQTSGVTGSFLRSIEGALTVLTLPDGTPLQALSINAAGEITGDIANSQGIVGFLRHRNGTVEIFNAGPNTRPRSINDEGDITGFTSEPGNIAYGFLRSAEGAIVSFAVPGAAFFYPNSVNDLDQVTGVYSYPANIFLFHSFVRDGDGVITTFDPPGATESYANSINIAGTITGWYADSAGGHGFLRFREGVSLPSIRRGPR